VWIAVHSRDLPDPGDADLAVADAPQVAARDNGFERVRWAKEAMRISDDDYDRAKAFALGHSEDQRWAKREVAQNADSLAELRYALTAPSFVYPAKPETEPYADFDGAMAGAIRLVWLERADARLLAEQGSAEAARARALFGIHLGQRFADAANPGLSEITQALNAQRVGLAALADVIRSSRLRPDEAARLGAELESSRISAASWAKVWDSEYQIEKAMLLRFRTTPAAFAANGEDKYFRPLHPYVSRFTYQPMRTAAAYADDARRHQAAYATHCTRDPRLRYRPPGGRERLATAVLRGNVIGVWLVELNLPQLPTWNFRRCQVETFNSLLQTAVALRARWDVEHDLPESLDELVPRYLAAVPSDAFGGRPIRYDPSRRVLHSIGSDFKDEGGAFEPPGETEYERRTREEREPTVSVDFQ